MVNNSINNRYSYMQLTITIKNCIGTNVWGGMYGVVFV